MMRWVRCRSARSDVDRVSALLLVASQLLPCSVFAGDRTGDPPRLVLAQAASSAGAGSAGVILRGTLVYSEQRQSIALIELSDGTQFTMRVGAALPGVGVLARVENKRVFFDVGASQLMIGFNDSATLRSGDAGAASHGVATAATGMPVAAGEVPIAATHTYVVPDRSVSGVAAQSDAEDPRLDATPKPGQSIDTFDWDHAASQKSLRR
jgi:hypothetical protein